MMSLRAIARSSAPRALSRAAAGVAPIRSQAASLRSTSNVLRASLRPQQAVAAFSTSVSRMAYAKDELDEELSAKLASEIEFEESVKENEPTPTSIKDFLNNSPWELVDVAGKEEVVLKRTFGNENITVSFSIADLHNYEQDQFDEDSDAALAEDEFEDGNSRQRVEQEIAEGEEIEEPEPSVPCRLHVIVEKADKGALTIEATAQDGAVVVENMFYFKDAKLAHGESADASHKAQDVYPGPPFGSLDEDLQILMERYLEDRGINQALALFVPDYLDMKEQKEYLSWLNNIKGFVDA